MRIYERYHFRNETEVTVLCEFNTEEEMTASGLLDDPRRTTCFTSAGKWFIGGHFEQEAAHGKK